jgi:uncharacterized SAM-binding protein YcdF (DUF218 family)
LSNANREGAKKKKNLIDCLNKMKEKQTLITMVSNMYFGKSLMGVFGIVVAVVVQNAFHLEMN